ncbi:hypothetical protein [Pseudomonas arsenicoxydans]|uniref:Uncharacterized protein n=1 Tax=Pseudomonas arsenicoxydans TaxID=702115 RepID=A0A502I172_9PSED|nr:hypothetical protein [Pseudomonas arsenicoxydans]TPG79188.1 hypothetical protein EAH78_11115 [Pseudomonas arsenicoxydans]
MDEKTLFASVLTQIHENQLALGAAVEELSNWVEQNGDSKVAGNIRGALETLDRNQDFIALALLSISTDFNEPQNPKKPGS